MVLLQGADEETTFWGWSSQQWLALIGTSAQHFLRRWPGWLDGSVGPYVAAYAYLLAGFTDFHLLGSFNRVALAWRVIGRCRSRGLTTPLVLWLTKATFSLPGGVEPVTDV
ncbi:hypothetical protein [Nonomuraea sp. KM90]|uniref:hypothetical protein n=1 Tax=Nonomuraea sp. KM90 TaxID=3457428 RepID=UPI003FCD2411